MIDEKARVTVELVNHTWWDYSDYDGDQIKCACGWLSRSSLIKTREAMKWLFAEHLVEVINDIDWKN